MSKPTKPLPSFAFIVPWFGPQRARFWPLVERLTRQLESFGCGRPRLLMAAQEATHAPAGYDVIAVDPLPYERRGYRRRGNAGEAFDIKACLIMAWIDAGPHKGDADLFVVMDADNAVLADPRPAICSALGDAWSNAGDRRFYMLMPPDGGERQLSHPLVNDGKPCVEWSSCLLVFAPDARGMAAEFRKLWQTSIEPDHWLLEQRTWSLVCHRNGVLLPRALAWSRFWGPVPPDCVVHHQHGDEKWEALNNGGQRRST